MDVKNFHKLMKSLLELNLPKDEFAIFGSAPMAARGMRDSNDLDLIVKGRLWKKLSSSHEVIEGKKLIIGEFEIFKHWKPWFDDSDRLIDDADVIDGVRFVKLKDVLKWKRAMNREKDQKDIKLIEKFLKNSKNKS